ncbi:MAG: hypothetical protein DMF51_16085 [Acidobacteria bacterium]|nr:MAG: hypothetical protein DMF51_16085 [Acidobacteriota bacterium]
MIPLLRTLSTLTIRFGLLCLASQLFPGQESGILAATYYADPHAGSCGCGSPDAFCGSAGTCGTSGSPYACLGDAIRRACSGDTVIAGDGQYGECLRIDQSNLTIQAKNPRRAVIARDPGGPGCGGQSEAVLIIGSNNVLKDFIVTNSGITVWCPQADGQPSCGATGNQLLNLEVNRSGGSGIVLYTGGNTVRDGATHDNGDGLVVAIGATPLGGILPTEVTGVQSYANTGSGFALEGLGPADLTDITSRDNGEFGAYVASDGNHFTRAVMQRNGQLSGAVYLIGSNNTFAQGDISYNHRGIVIPGPPPPPNTPCSQIPLATSPTGNRFDGVDVHHNDPFEGIKLEAGSNTIIENSHVHHNAGSGIVEFAIGSIIRGCEIDNNGRDTAYEHGIYVKGKDGRIQYNKVHNNKAFGIHLWAAPYGSDSGHRYIVERNDIYDNGGTRSFPVDDQCASDRFLRTTGAGMVLGGDPGEANCPNDGLPHNVEIRYNLIHHNLGGFLYESGCGQSDNGNLFHHNTIVMNTYDQISLVGTDQNRIGLYDNIIIGSDPTHNLVSTYGSDLAPDQLNGNLYYQAGATQSTRLINWNASSYSFDDLRSPNPGVGQNSDCSQGATCCTDGATCNPIVPCSVGSTCFQGHCYMSFSRMDGASLWSQDANLADPKVDRWTAQYPGFLQGPLVSDRFGDYHLRQGSAAICGGVCVSTSGSTDIDGDPVLQCNRPGCTPASDGMVADYYLDGNSNGIADQYEQCVSPATGGAAYDRAVFPGNPAVEVCDGKDTNCDNAFFNGGEVDADGDGYYANPACGALWDCDDNDPTTYPGAFEFCDGKENDCNKWQVGQPPPPPPPDESDQDGDGYLRCDLKADCNDNDCHVNRSRNETRDNLCNGIDDNCDGRIDEGLGTLICGVGACQRTDCATSGNCVPGSPSPEICNGIDDDCNGVVDDNLAPNTCGVGACQKTVASCYIGTPLICTPGPPVAETCNGIDDDCNGLVDDGLGTTTCGVGACSRTVANCVNGIPNTCVPGSPGFEGLTSLETCFNGVDDDCDQLTDLDCAIDVPSLNEQNVVTGSYSGSVSAIWAASTDGTYEVFTEGGASTARQLLVTWAFPSSSLQAGTLSELKVEGSPNASTNDDFSFSSSGSSSSSCPLTGSSTGLSVTKTTDPNRLQAADLGIPSQSYVCVQATDSKRTSDRNQDTLTLDRLFVFPSPIAVSDYASAADKGTVLSGTTFRATHTSNNAYEQFQEVLWGGFSRLVHTWKFTNVPAGSSHKLHIEGNRTQTNADKDDFQFYWSTVDPALSSSETANFLLVTGAKISSPTDTSGGADSSFGPTTLSGTVYIRVIDTKITSGTVLDTLNVDHIAIKTIP